MIPPAKAPRRFSKVALGVNTALAWGAIYYGIATGNGGDIATPALGLLGLLYGAYVGVGHLDYRKVLSTFGPATVPDSNAPGAG